MDAVSIRVPYRHLNDAELELVRLGDPNGEINEARDGVSRRPVSSSIPSSSSPHSDDSSRSVQRSSLKTLIFSCMVGAGVQFGWALQLSLLTPYIQTLGIGHAFSSFIWLCGPITGFVVQPCVGIWSDRCHSKYGRRRPFILAGCLMISLAVTLIGFSADVGYFLGDTKDHCRTYKGPRYRAATVFIFGFWMLDLANNTVQGPARALLADLAGPDQRNSANAIFCSWMAFGNILGFSSGASGNWHRWFPFLTTKACCEVCGDLKAAFLVAVAFLMFCMLVTLYFAKEVPLEARPDRHFSDSFPLLNNSQQRDHVLSQANLAQNDSGRGSEILGRANSDGHLDFNSNVNRDQIEAFSNGPGAVLVNILTSLRHLPPGMHSVLLVMALTWVSWFPFFLFDTDWMGREVYHGNPNGELSESAAYQNGVREGAFGLLLNSITYSVPFSVTAELTADTGGGQGLATGVLNLAIVIPQMIVSLGAGPWDALFGGGNIPAFALASIFALAAGILAVLKLPGLSNSYSSAGFHGFG
ncbi:sucrose transport protein SUT4 isoform X3 [Elaeis guineensis]|uniref:Sucrose transport protein SUT4 isoform X2 n=1 Tax=Elaeis guineensis var. tenera TaxID=51953 RepID=A0A6I9S097_ELAGV|nr:sucrose transport protein SUT4 isoform X2 [Elaeis guineensis]